MKIFVLNCNKMLMRLIGFVIRKNIMPDNVGIIMAKLETYVFVPERVLKHYRFVWDIQ